MNRFLLFTILFILTFSIVPSCKGEINKKDQEIVPCRGIPGPEEVCIPGGTFTMGHERVKLTNIDIWNDLFNDFDPPHKVRLDPFFLDKYEVTNGEYKLCVDAGGCEPIRVGGGGVMCPDGTFSEPPAWDDPVSSNVPVLRLEFKNAEDYCRWMGKRLPTEAEWERAARGPEGFDYPWGNEPPDCGRMPYLGADCTIWFMCYGAETEVPPRGSSPGDLSVEGVYDLNGSVSELVADFYDPDFYSNSPLVNPVNTTIWGNPEGIHIGRGDDYMGASASFYKSIPESTSPSWSTAPSWIRTGDTVYNGFRCARDDDQEEYYRQFFEIRNKILKGVKP